MLTVPPTKHIKLNKPSFPCTKPVSIVSRMAERVTSNCKHMMTCSGGNSAEEQLRPRPVDGTSLQSMTHVTAQVKTGEQQAFAKPVNEANAA